MNILLEWIAVLLNVSFVVLIALRIIWGWIPGIIGAALSAWLFFSSQLYSETILYVFYALFGLYGWWSWSRPRNNRIVQRGVFFHLKSIAVSVAGGLMLGYVFQQYSNAKLPFFDAFSSSFSFVATWIEAQREIHHWLYWTVINAFSIWLYASRGLDILAGQMVIFTLLSIWGWFKWKKAMA